MIVASLLALLLAPAVEAAPLDETFRATGSARFVGEGSFELNATGMTRSITSGDEVLDLSVEGGRWSLYNVRGGEVYTRDPQGGERAFGLPYLDALPLREGRAEGPIRVTLHGAEQGGVRFLGLDGAFSYRVETRQASIDSLGTRVSNVDGSVFNYIYEAGGRSVRPQEPHTQAHITGGPIDVTGAYLLVVGAEVELPDGTRIDVPGRHPDERLSHQDPVSRSEVVAYENHVLLIDAEWIQVHSPVPWVVAATGIAGRLQGVAEWRGLHGSMEVGGDRVSDPHVLGIDGNVSVAAQLLPGGGYWSVHGAVAQVSIDLGPFQSMAPGVVAGLAAVGALVAVLSILRGLAAVTAGRITDPLENETRRAILDAIHMHQPASIRTLQEATGRSRGTLRYHLDVMASAHVVQRIRSSNRSRLATYALNSNSLLYEASVLSGNPEDGDVVVGRALATTHHPVRRRIYEMLVESGPMSPGRMRQVLSEGTEAASAGTVSYHLRVMSDAGLVHSWWRGGSKLYAPRFHQGRVRGQQYRSFLSKPVWRDAVSHAMEAVGATRASLLQALCDAGHDAREARRGIASLEKLGVLRADYRGVSVNPIVEDALRRMADS